MSICFLTFFVQLYFGIPDDITVWARFQSFPSYDWRCRIHVHVRCFRVSHVEALMLDTGLGVSPFQSRQASLVVSAMTQYMQRFTQSVIHIHNSDVINFIIYQAFLLYVHYMRENVRRFSRFTYRHSPSSPV